MNIDGHTYLSLLAACFPNGFEARFLRNSTRLNLGAWLSGSELSLLQDAAYFATLCNVAFNGLGGCGGQIKPWQETNRIILERKFMATRDRFLRCRGWQVLTGPQRDSINRIFLTVLVTQENLAW
jgi:hypothetical protein